MWDLAKMPRVADTGLQTTACNPTILTLTNPVSCLKYHAPNQTLAVGFHDTGRVELWQKRNQNENGGTAWELKWKGSGHLHGTSVVA
jgi:WD40 repeat protein